MDAGDFWQENKRALTWVGCGLLVFLIANTLIEGSYGQDLRIERRNRAQKTKDLEKPRYSAQDRDEARDENEGLRAALERLAAGVAFRPRPEFVLDPARGSAGAQYFTLLEEVRESLSLAASRARLVPPDDSWGIEAAQSNSEPLIERHLAALDAIDRLVRLAIAHGVQRIDRLQVALDAGYGSRQGLGHVEHTTIQMQLSTGSASLTAFLAATQDPTRGPSLPLVEYAAKGHPSKPDEVKADLRFAVVRLHDLPGAEDEAEVE